MAKPIELAERKAMLELFNSLPVDDPDRYHVVAKAFNRAISSCYRSIKQAQQEEAKLKYYDPKNFPFF